MDEDHAEGVAAGGGGGDDARDNDEGEFMEAGDVAAEYEVRASDECPKRDVNSGCNTR